MQEEGIDIAGQQSKAFDWDLARQMDVVVTVCDHANESCPVLPPEVHRLHWSLEDPAAATGTEVEVLAKFREIRDLVASRVTDLLRLPVSEQGKV
jgi:arsenate reductase